MPISSKYLYLSHHHLVIAVYLESRDNEYFSASAILVSGHHFVSAKKESLWSLHYTNTISAHLVRSVLWVIEELKLPVKFVEVNFLKKEHLTEEFKKINPQHTVPTLVDDDFILGDSHAIVTYLISKYAKDDSLYPTDLKLRAIIDQRLHFDSGILFTAGRGAFSQVLFLGKNKISQEAFDKIKSAYEFTDQFATNTWLAGEQFTVADICCVTTISSLNEIYPIEADKYPKLYSWFKRCSELPIYKTKNEPGTKELGEIVRSKLA